MDTGTGYPCPMAGPSMANMAGLSINIMVGPSTAIIFYHDLPCLLFCSPGSWTHLIRILNRQNHPRPRSPDVPSVSTFYQQRMHTQNASSTAHVTAKSHVSLTSHGLRSRGTSSSNVSRIMLVNRINGNRRKTFHRQPRGKPSYPQ